MRQAASQVLCVLAAAIIGAVLMAALLPRPPTASVTLHQLTFFDADSTPSVSTDGRTVTLVSLRDGNRRIGLKQLQTGSETALLVPGNVAWPGISHDGKCVLYHTVSPELDNPHYISAIRLSDGALSCSSTRTGTSVRKDFPSPLDAPVKGLVLADDIGRKMPRQAQRKVNGS